MGVRRSSPQRPVNLTPAALETSLPPMPHRIHATEVAPARNRLFAHIGTAYDVRIHLYQDGAPLAHAFLSCSVELIILAVSLNSGRALISETHCLIEVTTGPLADHPVEIGTRAVESL